jgi:hypothetical protein
MSRSEPRRGARLIAPLVLATSALWALACGPKLTPEEQVELLRSQYTAELKSLTVKQDPVAATASDSGVPAGSGEAAAGETAIPPDASGEPTGDEAASLAAETPAEDAAASGAVAQAPGPAVRTDVILDILVSTTSQEYLPGITIDVEHVDADRKVKDRRTLWVDTSTLVRGGGTQVTHVLEVRTPVPAELRAEYREFQSP